MIIARKSSAEDILQFISPIEGSMPEWQIVTFKLLDPNSSAQEQLISKLMADYKSRDGFLFTVKHYKVVMVVRFGVIPNFAALKKDIQKRVSAYSCFVSVRKASMASLERIKNEFTGDNASKELSLFEAREKRADNVFLVCDDDMFVRKSLVTMLSSQRHVHEIDSGDKVCDAYREYNPDIVLLDIHMPGKDGLTIINDVIDMDEDAFIIMISADSSMDNVLEALSCGSVGFLSKPVMVKKMFDFSSQCITYRA